MSKADEVRDLRAVLGHRLVNFIGAAGLLTDEHGQILLVRRRGSERWGPVTGIAELGEPLQDTLKREHHEEAGLHVHAAHLIEVKNPDHLATVANGDPFYSYTALYRVTEWHAAPTPDGVEIAEARFFPLADLPPLTRLGVRAKELLT